MAKFFDHIVLMICENTGWDSVQDLQFVKYINQYGCVFEHWSGAVHPSGPNYRTMMSGQPWSGNEYDGVARPNIAPSIDYKIVDFKGIPAVRHNPFMDMNPTDTRATVHVADWATAVADLPDLLYLGMDDLNNAHSASLNTADANVVDGINFFNSLTDPSRLFIVLFDEGYGLNYIDNHIFCGMLGPTVPVRQVGSPCSHYSLAQFFCDNWAITGLSEMDPKCKTYAGRNLIELN